MNRYNHLMLLCWLALLPWLSACDKKETAKKTVPAEVKNPVQESELTTLTLTKQAEKRLGIQTTAISQRAVAAVREVGGEIQAVPGQSLTVVAPLQGTLQASGASPVAGERIAKGRVLYRLVVLPAEQSLLTIKEEVAQREVQLRIAQTRLQRAEDLLQDRAGSIRSRDDAQAEAALAERGLQDARARLGGLSGNAPNSQSALLIRAPLSGIVQRVNGAPGQVVTGGTPLLELANLGRVWVRVPLYAGDLTRFDAQKPVQISFLSGSSTNQTLTARPVAAPLAAAPNTATVDVFYQLTNPTNELRPGQRVVISMPLKTRATGTTVPLSAILYDINGGQWVYTRSAPHVYSRQRVEVDRVVADQVVLARGPANGTEVVIAGAAELYGTEFGGAK